MKAIAALTVFGLLAPCMSPADPAFECAVDFGSQVEIADCVAATERRVESNIESALGFAMASAKELDDVTGRSVAVPALEAGQAAWVAYRDAHCDYVGATFGGGSGTGIAIRGCRVELGRDRVDTLLGMAR